MVAGFSRLSTAEVGRLGENEAARFSGPPPGRDHRPQRRVAEGRARLDRPRRWKANGGRGAFRQAKRGQFGGSSRRVRPRQSHAGSQTCSRSALSPRRSDLRFLSSGWASTCIGCRRSPSAAGSLPDSMDAIVVEGLHKRYGRTVALDGLSFAVPGWTRSLAFSDPTAPARRRPSVPSSG